MKTRRKIESNPMGLTSHRKGSMNFVGCKNEEDGQPGLSREILMLLTNRSGRICNAPTNYVPPIMFSEDAYYRRRL
jgi:hypothetical protein